MHNTNVFKDQAYENSLRKCFQFSTSISGHCLKLTTATRQIS